MLKYFLMIMIVSCSSQQQQEELPPENSANSNETLNSSSNQSAEQLGTSANNSAKNEFANGAKNAPNGAPISNPSGNLGTSNPSSPNLFGGNSTIPANPSGAANAAASGLNANGKNSNNTDVADQSGKPVMEGKEYTNTHMNWPGKGRVKYIRAHASRHEAPNGAVVGQFEKGDHPLVMKEGDWAELSDGSYMTSSDLSEAGVGRDKK